MLNTIDFEKLGISDEAKAAILAAVTEETTGLANKNAELLGKLKKAKEGGTATESELERLRQLEQNLEVEAAEAKKNYTEALALKEQQFQKREQELIAQVEAAQGTVSTLLVDNGLSAALDAANVAKELKPAVVAMFKSAAEVKEGKAFIGDKELTEHITDWAKSEEAKAFIAAPANSGGGAPPGGGSPTGKKFSEMGSDEKTKLFNENRAEYDRLKAAEPPQQRPARKI